MGTSITAGDERESRAHRSVFALDLGDALATLNCIDEASKTYELRVGDVLQSQVSLRDPTVLEFDYVRRIARVIDAWAPAGHPLAVAHLGAGALTLTRYVAATRAASRQWVIERERAQCEAVLAALPLVSEVELLYGDARDIADGEGVTSWTGADVTVVDLWAGAVISARVASEEFYRAVRGRTSADGVVCVNLLDGPGFVYARGQAAALRAVFGVVAACTGEVGPRNCEAHEHAEVEGHRKSCRGVACMR